MIFKNNDNNFSLVKKDPIASALIVILFLLIVLLAIFLPGKIFRIDNIQSLAYQMPVLGILTLAMAITMISGGINLSIIGTNNICGIVTGFLIKFFISNYSFGTIVSIIIAILAGWLVSLLIGFLIGFTIAYLDVPPILVTLGFMTFLQGINLLLTKGYAISGFPTEFQIIGNGTIKGIPISFLIFFIVFLFISILLYKTPFGTNIYLIGSNRIASKFSGIDVKKSILNIYILSSFLCGISSTLLIAYFNSAKAGYASSYLLLTILASVMAGVDPNGGFGKPLGLLISIIILQTMSIGFNLIGLRSHLTIALWGAILIILLKLKDVKFMKNF